MSEAWTPFEHRIWKNLKEYGLDSRDQFVIATSGGLDSMVLLQVFLKLRPKAQVKVVYYHHGDTSEKSLQNYRDQSYDFVRRTVECLNKENIVFLSEKSKSALKSEEQMREARWAYLRSQVESQAPIVTAHHLDDHLETILLKMIRGTSLDGFLSFKMWDQEIFRPFLEVSKAELKEYAKYHNISWVEDPSNTETHYLRNWIRENWLKDLDDKVTKGRENLAKSLLRIFSEAGQNQTFELVYEPNDSLTHLSRSWYVSLPKSDQLRALALFLKKHQIHNFSTGQLEEIRKRLDKNQKDITFEILGRKWVINATQIMLE